MSVWDELPTPKERPKSWEGFAAAVIGTIIASPFVAAGKGAAALYTYSQRERDDTEYLEQRARELYIPIDGHGVSKGMIEGWRKRGDPPACYSIMAALAGMIEDVAAQNAVTLPTRPEYEDQIEAARYRDALRHRIDVFAHPEFEYKYVGALIESAFTFVDHLPPLAASTWEHLAAIANDRVTETGMTVSLLETLPNVPQTVQDVCLPFYEQTARKMGLFASLTKQLDENMEEVSGNPDKLILPPQSRFQGDECVNQYLKHTPLRDLFYVRIPFAL